MLRQVLIPSKENSTVSIPAEFYGTKVEVLMFPFHDPKENQNDNSVYDKRQAVSRTIPLFFRKFL